MSIAMSAAEPYSEMPGEPGPGSTVGVARLREEGLPQGDLTYATWIHLALPIGAVVLNLLAFLGPLVLWLARKDKSAFADDHGREAVNVAITGIIVTLLAWIPVIGWFGAPIWYIVTIINVVRGCVAANGGEYFRYPLTIRFL